MMNKTAIIILAAGSASRFGGNKQLLPFNNTTLLQHVVDEAVASGAHLVIVVTGANANEIVKALQHEHIEIVFNENWTDGVASSIVAGLKKAISLDPDLEKVIFTVCDQPFVSSNLFEQLVGWQEPTAANILACAYGGTIGTPALFTKKYFDQLMALKGDEGAKKILLLNPSDLVSINFPEGAIDIDTQNDYESLLHRSKHR